MAYITCPNAPTAKVTLVAVSSLCVATHKALQGQGVGLIIIEPHPQLAAPVCTHPDMVLHHLGGKDILLSPMAAYLAKPLQQHGFTIHWASKVLEQKYPQDIALNFARAGDFLFGNSQYIDKSLLSFCKQQGVQLMHTQQGYAKCSACIVGQDGIITQDPSLYAAAIAAGLDALQITPGHITLPGYDYGFIGGCSGMLDKNKIAFNGDITKHPDFKQINIFLQKKQIEFIILTKAPLWDIGSVLPLLQEDL